ncbi:MAG: YibE/F family protein [Actinomycetota bacterium]
MSADDTADHGHHDHDAVGHSHGHGHGLDGGWERWASVPTLRVVAGLVALTAFATLVALIVLWPTGDGRQQAIANADDLGLVSERVSATVQEQRDGPCSYSTDDNPQTCREVTLIVNDGPEAGALVILPEINLRFETSIPSMSPGEDVILGYEPTTNAYFFADLDRRTPLMWLAIVFAVFVVGFGRSRGVLALSSMTFTVVALVGFVAPSVLDGNDPLLVAVVGASAIAFVSLYVTHGFSPTTTVALAGTLGALALTLALAWVFFELTRITGLGTEEALILPFITTDIDLAALLLGGAVIGALGALDDITITQVASVAEIHDRRPDLSRSELFASGIRIGQEHIASTVNTLLLAYVGASMPLLLLFSTSDQSLDTVANSEVIAVEIVRTLCGSMGLVAAVPITTAMAALVVTGEGGAPEASADGDDGPDDDSGPAPEEPAPDEGQTTEDDELSEPTRPAARWEDFSPEESDGL